MKILLTTAISVIILLSTMLCADEVYMRNGKVWKNVSILEAQETPQRISIWTSNKGTLVLKKKDIHGVILQEFDRDTPSQLEKIVDGLPENLIKYKASVEAEQKISGNDSLLLTLPQSRFSFSVGYAKYASDLTSTDNNELANDLKNGYNFMFNAAKFNSPKLGVNFSISRMTSSAIVENVRDDRLNTFFDIDNNLNITYLGLGLLGRGYSGGSGIITFFGATLGAGITSITADAKETNGSLTDESDLEILGLGGQALLSVEKFITENFSIGSSFTFTTLRFKSVKLNGRTRELFEAEYIQHFTINISLQIHR